MTTVPTSSSRSTIRVPVFVALGAFFWFLAAMAFRFLGPAVLAPGTAVVPLIFALGVPIAWAFVWAGTTAIGVRGAAVMSAVVIMSATALILDGLALTFFPSLYGLPTASLLLVGAFLMWGVGLILVIAFVQTRRAG